jgi:hypothetical protein
MSTELAIATDRGQSLAELMGVSEGGGSTGPSIARLNMLHQPIMGEVELNGKKIKTEVVPIGAYTLKMGDDIYYSTSVTVRIFAQRQQWQRWNSTTEEMEKSVLANTLSGDLQDSIGGFNLGRPSGYIEDFNSVPEATKELMRSVKRVKVFFGTVTLDNPTDASGEPIEAPADVPFIMDVKNRDSMKNIDKALNSLKGKNLLPIMSELKLVGVEDSIPTGARYGKIEASLGNKVDITPEDNDTLKSFIELLEYMNGKILDLYHERNKESMSDEDAAIVTDIIDGDNGFVEVQE